MDRFPALRLILKLGRKGAAALALMLAILAVWLLWSSLGWMALLPAPLVFAIGYFLIKSYVEIVQIITEMVH